MTNIKIEEWFSSSKRWAKGHECLNMENINQKPYDYNGNLEEWIKDLTTFIFIYPKEWNMIYSEYRVVCAKRGLKNNDKLEFYRDDEGYLRKCHEQDIFLRIRLLDFKYEDIKTVLKLLDKNTYMSFEEYLKYCNLQVEERKTFIKKIKSDFFYMLKENIGEVKGNIQITFENDYDTSDFSYRDIYVDILNDTFVIL